MRSSPMRAPINARASGALQAIRPCDASDSSSPTIVRVRRLSSSSANSTDNRAASRGGDADDEARDDEGDDRDANGIDEQRADRLEDRNGGRSGIRVEVPKGETGGRSGDQGEEDARGERHAKNLLRRDLFRGKWK